MADYKSKIIAYIEGKLSSEEFFSYLEDNPGLFDWLQSLVPEGKTQNVHEEVALDYFLAQHMPRLYRRSIPRGGTCYR